MTTTPDEAKRHGQALTLARRAADKHRRAERDLLNAMRFARDEGVSLRAIADAVDMPHTTVVSKLERDRTT